MEALFPTIVYSLCFLTSAGCAGLLIRGFWRTRGSLLFWSALCFLLLALNNFIVVVDLLVIPGSDLSLHRLLASLAAVTVLMFGFIWRGDEA